MTQILQEVCSLPTAPFLEKRVVEYAKKFVAERKKLRLAKDEHGNLLISLPGRSKAVARWVFTAHMDHPGLVSRRMIDEKTVECDFRGWVLAELMKGVKVRFFDGGREILGVIEEVTGEGEEAGGAKAKTVRVKVKKNVRENVAGMFDVGTGRMKDGKFYCRVC